MNNSPEIPDNSSEKGPSIFEIRFQHFGGDSKLYISCKWEGGQVSAPFKYPRTSKVVEQPWTEDAETRGRQIFDALFPPPLKTQLDLARNKYPEGLRLNLEIPANIHRRQALEKIPWEYAFDLVSGEFLGLSPQLPLTRATENLREIAAAPKAGNPRILVAIANPTEKPLGWEKELEAIQHAWRSKGDVDDICDCSFREFCDRIRELESNGGLDLIHFIGHGGIFKKSQAFLAFGTQASPEYLSASEVATQLNGCKGLRLVILSACSTAAPSKDWAHDPSRSVAYALLQRGVPAVIGTRNALSNDAAASFSGELHRLLAEGESLDLATSQARRKVARQLRFHAKNGYFEWSTPILYCHARNPKFFTMGLREAAPHRLAISCAQLEYVAPPRCPHLDLRKSFIGRQLAPGHTWQELYRQVLLFLKKVSFQGETELRLDAFLSVAFAVGFKVGTTWPLTIVHRQPPGIGEVQWRVSDRPAHGTGADWRFRLTGDRSNRHLVVAVSVTHPTGSAVKSAWQHLGGGPAMFLSAALPTGHQAIEGADHAWRLAQQLATKMQSLVEAAQESSTIHLFLAGPAAFALYLGQLCGQLGTIQLYHFDPERSPKYSPSILVKPSDRLLPIPTPETPPEVERTAKRPPRSPRTR